MLRRGLSRLLDVREHELAPIVGGFGLFFLLFAGYFLLRPVRETMGIAGGVENLQWLFTGTFLATLAAMPLFGWIAARVQRRRILYWIFGGFALQLLAFALAFAARPDDVWLARAFYIWLSVFNLIAVSVAWSLLVDLFPVSQAKRLFGLMAAGASLGGLAGPLLGVLLVDAIGHPGLLSLSAALLVAAAGAAQRVQAWCEAHPQQPGDDPAQRRRALGGSPLAGAGTVLGSPFLLGIAAFVLLLASVSTFLYFEQARLVELRFPDKHDQTRVFGTIDVVVQSLAILSQLFLTGRLAQRLGIGVLLVAVPLLTLLGFAWLALAPTFAVLAVVMVARRAGEYAFIRPGREMLWTAVAPEAKYKAKNFVDTVVYRGADAVSGWVKAGVDLLAQQPAIAAVLGAGIALLWACNGALLARVHRRLGGTASGA